ncbi:MAG: enoyl-CoA hydratase [Hyphomonadaceae bacterium]
MASLVTIEKFADGAGLVTMNRPEAMNALSRALRRELASAFAALNEDDDVRAIVLTGAGRAFTAGLDLKELAVSESVGEDTNSANVALNPVKAIESCKKPVIGAVNGAAITGGFEVALACDILIGSENARFADTHARVGILPGWGLSQKLSRMLGISRAKEISLTGNFVDAQTALAWGLLNRVVPAADLIETALKLARDIASAPARFTQAYKRLIDEGAALPYGEALAHETAVTAALNNAVTADDVAKSRTEVTARGRQQTQS